MITAKAKPAGRGISAAQLDKRRLEIVAELANAPLVSLWPPKHLAQFQDLLASFFRMPGTRRLIPTQAPQDLSREAIAELKEWTDSMLDGWLVNGKAVVGLTPTDLDPALLVELIRDRSGHGTIGAIKGPPSAVFALAVGILLMSEAGSRLRRCGDPRCGRVFLRSGKMEHCSTRCARRVYMREYRKS